MPSSIERRTDARREAKSAGRVRGEGGDPVGPVAAAATRRDDRADVAPPEGRGPGVAGRPRRRAAPGGRVGRPLATRECEDEHRPSDEPSHGAPCVRPPRAGVEGTRITPRAGAICARGDRSVGEASRPPARRAERGEAVEASRAAALARGARQSRSWARRWRRGVRGASLPRSLRSRSSPPSGAATAPKGGDIGSRFSTRSQRGDEATGEVATLALARRRWRRSPRRAELVPARGGSE